MIERKSACKSVRRFSSLILSIRQDFCRYILGGCLLFYRVTNNIMKKLTIKCRPCSLYFLGWRTISIHPTEKGIILEWLPPKNLTLTYRQMPWCTHDHINQHRDESSVKSCHRRKGSQHSESQSWKIKMPKKHCRNSTLGLSNRDCTFVEGLNGVVAFTVNGYYFGFFTANG